MLEIVNMLIALIGSIDSMHLCRNIPYSGTLWIPGTPPASGVWERAGKEGAQLCPSLFQSVSQRSQGLPPSPTPPLSELPWTWFFPFTIDSVNAGYCYRVYQRGIVSFPWVVGDSRRMMSRGLPSWAFRNAQMEIRQRACVELPRHGKRHSGWRK